jgi:hypothetical protein
LHANLAAILFILQLYSALDKSIPRNSSRGSNNQNQKKIRKNQKTKPTIWMNSGINEEARNKSNDAVAASSRTKKRVE